MRKILLALILVLCPYIFSQTTTFDEDYRIFGNYTLTEQTVPTYNIGQQIPDYYPGETKADATNGQATATVDGCTETVTYTVKATYLGWIIWTITYSDGTSETYYGSNEDAVKHAYEEAYKKAVEMAKKEAEEKRLATPIGNSSILLLFCGIYVILRRKGLGNKV